MPGVEELTRITGEGRVSLEASVLSVANSLMVSMMDSVFTPVFCMLASKTSAMMLEMLVCGIKEEKKIIVSIASSQVDVR